MLGIFDSGIGGLTVVKALLHVMPDLSFIYVGDTGRVPYGNKSEETIVKYAEQHVNFLISQGVDTILVACNTVSSRALPKIRLLYPLLSFFDVINPVVKEVCSSEYANVGVIGTRATINSDVYAELIKLQSSKIDVYSLACPLFVPLAEEGWACYPETQRLIRRSLSPLRRLRPEALILGCTHYPMLQNQIARSFSRRTRILDTPNIVAREIQNQATRTTLERGRGQRFCFTDTSEHTVQIAKKWLERNIKVELVSLEREDPTLV